MLYRTVLRFAYIKILIKYEYDCILLCILYA